MPTYPDLPYIEYSIYSPGKVWYDATYRGGTQKERYYETCTPMPAENINYACDMLASKDDNSIIFVGLGDNIPEDLTSNGKPCCLFPTLHFPPPKDFVSKM